METNTLERKTKKERSFGSSSEDIGEKAESPDKMSHVYGWPDIPKNGGGDIDLADYSLNHPNKKKIKYNELP